jgi:integrase
VFIRKWGVFRYSPKYCRLVLKDAVGRDDVTIHGIRSTFRDWCAATGADFETAERCLSHQTTTQVQRAYLRRDYFEERKALLQKWADVLLTNVKD